MQELVKLVGFEHDLTLAYSKEESAVVERANKEVMRHLRAILLDKNIVTDWSNSLPLVQRIMNASVHSAIGVSPAQLLFGNAITLDRGIILSKPKASANSSTETPHSEWAANMLEKQANIMRVERAAQKERDDFHIVQATTGQITEYPVNSYVLVKYRDRPPTKFHLPWKGPLRVVSYKKGAYVLQDLVTNSTSEYHVTQLKPFTYDKSEIDPVEVARKEAQEFVVRHTGTPW
jgi:hypothetical protein